MTVLTTLGPTITPAGISIPTYADIYETLQSKFQGIYGSDSYIAPDSQDGQMLAVFASAQDDSNKACVAAYNSFPPAYAQGAGLSSVMKINGIRRLVASNSSTPVTIVGQAGTTITNGVVGDNQSKNTKWTLPTPIIIPPAGEIIVTATCTALGSTEAAPGTLTVILTPTLGWQTVTNANSATPGAPVETDAEARIRQAKSTSIPSQSVLESIIGSLANISGVTRSTVHENDTDAVDSEGVPAHTISAVVLGGDVNEIANTIAIKKTPGTGTYGSTAVLVTDSKGVPNEIRFYTLAVIQLDVAISIKALTGYASTTGDLIKLSLAQAVSTLEIGEDSYLGDLYSPINLSGDAAVLATGMTQAQLDVLKLTYKINIGGVTQARHGDALLAADVPIAFNEATALVIGNISLTVT